MSYLIAPRPPRPSDEGLFCDCGGDLTYHNKVYVILAADDGGSPVVVDEACSRSCADRAIARDAREHDEWIGRACAESMGPL